MLLSIYKINNKAQNQGLRKCVALKILLMKQFLGVLTVGALLVSGCGTPTEPIISKSTMKIENKRMSAEALWALGRLDDAQVSPDGKRIAYGVTYYSVEQNKSNREIFLVDIDGKNNKQITRTAESEYGAKWVKGGTKLAFLSAASGEVQVWEMNPDGSNRKQVTNHNGGVSDFLYSPDDKHIIFIADVKYGERTIDKHPDLPMATGRIVDDLMFKHWDEWVETVPHPFLADYDGKVVSNVRDILVGEPYECPMKPFGGVEQLAFSPDGKKIAYTCRKKTGLEYAVSTNSDIYLYDIELDKTTRNLTEGMLGYDINPAFSPDGTKIAWQSMEHAGWESDKNRLMVADLETGTKSDVSENWDQSTDVFTWSADGKSIYLISCQHGTSQLYSVDVNAKMFKQLTVGQHDYTSVAVSGDKLVAIRQSMSAPNDIFVVEPLSGNQTQITFENKELLAQMDFGKVEERWMTTNDGKQMLVWIIYPPHFDATKKYPTLLYCEGGPQSPVSQFWSYRWNFQMMAANDYIIVAPNRRGLYGFGSEWLEQISGDYGGKCMEDYFTAIDTYCQEPWVDRERLGCVGASFGGYSVYWIAGHHNKRFKAFIAHDGMFNFEQQYLETEEMWFVNRDLGGAYWEDSEVVKRSYANSPHLFVDKWDTPILCIHGEKDYRILASQSMAAFSAAKLRGVPAELLIFPDENHWVLKPQNGILWQRTFFGWLDKWLK